ncbi:MAG: DUF927 domain-containing protein [Clostridia bacterium]|nr:DUF927 domain-containing protein [Clostridia bacterium]
MGLPADYDENSILSDGAMESIFMEQDTIVRARLLVDFQARARELDEKIYPTVRKQHILKDFCRMVKAWESTLKEAKGKKKNPESNYTDFAYFDDGHEMYCGMWIANMNGVKMYSDKGEIIACYHPILPIERLKNLETGQEQLQLAYYRNNRWNTVKVAKSVVATASRITALSDMGILVTSENARALVRYLSDIENYNEKIIPVQNSTAKLGWHGKDFIPYDGNILFDGDNRFKTLFESIHEKGDADIWLNHVKQLRATGRNEISIMLASSFASVLIDRLNGLPFFVDLWGETEGGKTVTLMLAASVWANPDESQYIGDFKTTDVALEAKADMLNHLPMILDDTSKTSARIRDNFEVVIYDLCSGKGKSRSNKELGINRENRWKNCILSNGERPLNSYANQGGAINRIIEVECKPNVYKDPQKTADILKKNYGFAGRLFVNAIKEMPEGKLLEIYNGFLSELYSTDKMQKQAIAVSVILTADKIATDYIFMDKKYINMEKAKELLMDREEVSDNERCYQYILDKIYMNQNQRFNSDVKAEQWGIIEDDEYAIIYVQAFKELCEAGGFSYKSFMKWADENSIIQAQNGRTTIVKKIDGLSKRCVCIRLRQKDDNDDFILKTEQNIENVFS